MKKIRKIFFSVFILLFSLDVFAKGDCYIYDFWGEIEKSPDAYGVSSVFYANNASLDVPLKNPNGLFCYDNLIYIVDTDNNRIIEFIYTKSKEIVFSRIIDSFFTSENIIDTFSCPKDVFVNKDGSFFVADTNNNRVVKFDKNLNFIMELREPADSSYEKGKAFLPEKVVADTSGRTYVLAKNVNKGLLMYEADGSFAGFYGASEVIFSWTDYIWKLLSTKEQRAQLESFVPTEYSNVFIDNEGFLFAVTKTFEEWDLLTDVAKPIRRLNALGKDILIKNGEYPPIGDLQWDNAAGIKGPSRFSDITVLDNEIYIAIDENRCRLFGYDNQGYLLFSFGGKGNIDGFFKNPVAIEHMGRDLFILDSQNASLTIFTPTLFGNMIYDATEAYSAGEYDKSAEIWQKVVDLNGNYDLGYIGLGKACLRQEKYKEAMKYFDSKHEFKKYSKAFMYYRKEWVEKNIGFIVAGIILIVVIALSVSIIKKIKQELKNYELYYK